MTKKWPRNDPEMTKKDLEMTENELEISFTTVNVRYNLCLFAVHEQSVKGFSKTISSWRSIFSCVRPFYELDVSNLDT